MIPKIIHFCWFGGKEKPEIARKCMASWEKFLPDYELLEWNEDNFDIHCCPYVEEAYQAKRYAFVTDYVRLYVLYHYGGIYMDTDVEVVRPLDPFLALHGFSGFEKPDEVPTGIMAAEKGLPFIEELLHDYDDLHFLDKNGSPDMTTNVIRITNAAVRHGLKQDNTRQTVADFTFFPMDVFCPKDPRTRQIRATANTCTIHHFAGSWQSAERQKEHQLVEELNSGRVSGPRRMVIGIERKFLHLKKHWKERGFLGMVRLYLNIDK